MTTPLQSEIESQAAKALRLRSRDRERQAHSIPDLIEADKYLAEQQVAQSGSQGFRIMRIKPPGTIG